MPYQEILTKGDLPHWYMPGAAHFVTYRLVDTLPFEVLQRIRAKRDELLPPETDLSTAANMLRSKVHKQFFGAFDRYLDLGLGNRWLAMPEIAKIVVENLYHHHESRYHLLEYTVMPNHVHVLFVPIEADASSARVKLQTTDQQNLVYHSDEVVDSQSPLSQIMHSLKSYTANRANEELQLSGRFWQKESYDHWIRNDKELARVADYICNNAVSAKLVTDACAWQYCSAHDRKFGGPKKLPEWW